MEEIKIGDLVRFPHYPIYWWSDQVGVIDRIEPEDSGLVKYRVFVPPNNHARYSDPTFAQVISENR